MPEDNLAEAEAWADAQVQRHPRGLRLVTLGDPYVDPDLIESQPPDMSSIYDGIYDEPDDPLQSARGMVSGIALSVLIWPALALIAVGLWHLIARLSA